MDAFLRWESSRDLFWHPEGSGGGFGWGTPSNRAFPYVIDKPPSERWAKYCEEEALSKFSDQCEKELKGKEDANLDDCIQEKIDECEKDEDGDNIYDGYESELIIIPN